jgi:uncharacterized membrane protein
MLRHKFRKSFSVVTPVITNAQVFTKIRLRISQTGLSLFCRRMVRRFVMSLSQPRRTTVVRKNPKGVYKTDGAKNIVSICHLDLAEMLLYWSDMVAKQFRKTFLHWLFRIGIVFKGLDGLAELVGGFLFVFFSRDAMSDFVERNTRPVLQWDPDNLIAHSLRHSFDQMSTSGKIFVAIYLLGHGAIKLMLMVGLLREKRWVFPVAIVLLLGFIGFQVYRLCGHFSAGLLVFTVLDAVIVALVWNEYRSLKKQAK